MTKLSIGTMAKMNNISEQALRLYDRMGLFMPLYKDENNGYRYYDIRQCAHLDLILYLKALGMELKNIKETFDQQDLHKIKQALATRHNQIHSEITNLTLQQKSLSQILNNIAQYENAPADGVIFLEQVKKRKMFLMDTQIPYSQGGTEIYENELRKLKLKMKELQLPYLYSLNSGSMIRQADFQEQHFVTNQIFVFVESSSDYQNQELRTLPQAYFLCTYCRNHQHEKKYMKQLFAYIDEKNYKIAGDYLCEVLTDFPFINQKGNGMFLKLQIPITFH